MGLMEDKESCRDEIFAIILTAIVLFAFIAATTLIVLAMILPNETFLKTLELLNGN